MNAKSDYRLALKNPAVAHCQKTWDRVYRKQVKLTKSVALARFYAGEAFRSAMPVMVGYENIRDFIGCVTFGMESGFIMEDTATRYFYAAQVALTANPRPKEQGPAPKSQAPKP